MKILQINKYHYIKGGADSVFFKTMQLLQSHGHEVIPFCTDNPKNTPSTYSKYFTYAPEIRDIKGLWNKVRSVKRFLYNDDSARKIEQLILATSPDVAHIHNLFNGVSLSILPVLRKYNVPVVLTVHEPRFICPSSYFNMRGHLCATCRGRLYLNCALHRCYQDDAAISIMSTLEMIHKEYLFDYNKYIDHYIFVSHRYKNLFAERHNYFAKKGSVLYNFCDNLAETSVNATREDYFLYYGRLSIEKGVKTFINAAKSLPNIKFKVAGTGPLADEVQNIPNVEYLGFVSGDKLESLVGNARYVVVPSEWEENNPMTVIESYAHGTPVVGAKIGGIPEIIQPGVTGYIFTSADVENLRKVILSADNISESEYKMLSLQARRFAEEFFNPAKHYEQLIDIYETVKK